MTTAESLLAEFDEEMSNTRRMLERLPTAKFSWKPHEKSMTLGGLGSHVANLPAGVFALMHMKAFTPTEAASTKDLLDLFDKNFADGRKALQIATEADLLKTIPTRPGVSKSRVSVLRSRVINHLVHHRAQLGLYLRLLDVAVPGMYGPSADEK